jgi:molecular chaperone DnaK
MGTQMNVQLGEQELTPADVSGLILGELKSQMQRLLDSRPPVDVRYEIGPAIVTVPAYFGLPAIEATRDAGRLAGLDVLELLHEPTAAAIYYCWKHHLSDGVYVVFDLGGGTFDVSVLRRVSGEFLVLGIAGDNFLGGDDFDRRLAEHLRQLLVEDGFELGLDVGSDPDDRLRLAQLITLAERAKKALSDQDEYVLRDQGSIRDKAGTPVVLETTITRATFESLIDNQLERTIALTHDALTKAHEKGDIRLDDIDQILLVGGSTYVPAVAEKVRQAFCKGGREQGSVTARCEAPIRDEPETAVALGAALRAAVSGVGIGDDQRRLRLWVQTAGATNRTSITVSGHVEPRAAELDLTGGRLRLTTPDGDLLGETEIKPGLRFAFPGVQLEAGAINELQFAVEDALGAPVALLARTIVHDVNQPQSLGRALSTAVLPKPIVMEGTDTGRLVRRVLLAEGTSLPAKAQFTFAVVDESGLIRLPIYQENRVIKELSARVGRIAIGTPVGVEITCDEQVRITVGFWVGEQQYGGEIEPPPPDAVPTEYEIEDSAARFYDALELLDEQDSKRLSRQYDPLREELDEARAGADYPKLIQRAADLEGLVREARMAEPLRPTLASLRASVEASLEMLPQASAIKPDLVTTSLQSDLASVLSKAETAYAARDRQTYEDAAHTIRSALQFLTSVTRVSASNDETIDVAVQAIMAVDQARELTQFALLGCMVTGNAGLLPGLQRQLAELDRLEVAANDQPLEVLNRCQVLLTEARRIHQQIRPPDTVAQELQGLLNVGSGADLSSVGTTAGLFERH